MKILFLNPPFIAHFSRTSRSPGVSKGGCVYYPYWLAYAAGASMKAGHDVSLLDASGKNLTLKETLSKIKSISPDLVVMDTVTPTFHNDIKILAEIKKQIKKAKLCLVGDHVSVFPEKSLELSVADYVTLREYDYTIVELANALEQKKSVESVPGIVIKTIKGKSKTTANRSPPNDKQLDDLPFVSEVYKKFLKVEDYFYPSLMYPEVTILTGRGCPNMCTFCKWPQTFSGRVYRKRSIANVVDEFKWIEKNLPQVKEIMVEDDTLTLDKQRTIDFCKALIDANVKVQWSCNARADVPLDVLQWMKKAGCRLMCVGIESSSQQILNNIKKGTTPDRIRQFMKDSKKAGVLVHGCFIVGNRGETKETILETAKFSRELNPDTAQFFPLMVYPGTEAYEYAKKEGHLTIISTPELSSEELNALCDQARREFYIRPTYILSKAKQAIIHPKEIPRLLKGSKTFFKFLFRK
jgi:radical SAM superfamily enzyme YgiQ (UPF0313 family)